MKSSDGLSVNRMMIEPTRPMTDDRSCVTVWVSIVRTIVTSLDRREMSSPTRWPAWKSSDSVTRRPKSSPRSWATTRSPTTPEQVRLEERADGLDAEQQEQHDDEPVEAGRVAADDDLARDPGDDQREQEPEAGREHERDDGDRERQPVRSEVAEEAAPRHATEAADLTDHGSGVGRDPGELGAHVMSLMTVTVAAECGVDVETRWSSSDTHR